MTTALLALVVVLLVVLYLSARHDGKRITALRGELGDLRADAAGALARVDELEREQIREVDGVETAVGHQVLVHTTDGQSIRGELAGVHSDGSHELRDVEYIVGRETREAGGELYVMKSNIARVQRVGRNGSA